VIVQAVNNYRPNWTSDDLLLWEDFLGAEVRGWCLKCMGLGIESGYDSLRYLAGIARDVYKTRREIDPNVVFHPENVREHIFVSNGHRSPAWKKKASEFLNRVGPVLAPKAPWPAKQPTLPRQRIEPPYSRDEESSFEAAARAMDGVLRPRVSFVIAASFGAGLDGRWLPHIRVEDIQELDGSRLAINVPAPKPRLVPVRKQYTSLLREAMKAKGTGRFLDRGVGMRGKKETWNDMSAAWRAILVEGLGQIKPARARNSWICAHLRNGTPLPYLAKLCGYPTASIIVGLIPLAFLDEDEQTAHKKALEA